MVRVDVDGRVVEAQPGRSVLHACLDAGIYVPHLCSHPDLPVEGGCSMCMVEVDGDVMKSCEVTVSDGMTVRTKAPAAEHVRTVALELMLAPHPKDCTSCAAYLNCELQAIMQFTGVAHSRMREVDKESARIGSSDSLMTREMFRCIQCARCIRACEDLRGVGVLGFNRAENGEVYVGTKNDVPFAETDCRFCSACVAVCPTGAIMDTVGVFSKDVPKQQALVPCESTCPAHTEIPLYLQLAGEGRYGDSAAVFREKLTFPLSLGYVCDHPCERSCKRGKLDLPLSIRETKRFAAEHDTDQAWRQRVWRRPATGRKVAVVGGGPAGLTGAYRLARLGHQVTVLERQAKPGGMLTYGIPKYRLDQQVVDDEVAILVEDSGFEVRTGVDVTDVAGLLADYDAVLVATGAQAGRRPAPWDGTWTNVVDGVVACRAWNGAQPLDLGATVTVIGGGNVAFDCARNARKLGATHVRVLCLEPRGSMLADDEEIRAATAEGIEIVAGVAVRAVVADGDLLTGVGVVDVRSFSFGPAGLQLDVVDGSDRVLPTDGVVLATGQQSDLTSAAGLVLRRGAFVEVDADGLSSVPGVFAAGDAVTGTASVVRAIAAGRAAAAALDRYLGGDGDVSDTFFDRDERDGVLGTIPAFSGLPRTACGTAAEVTAETSRCLHCELRRDIDTVRYWTDPAYSAARTVS